MRSVGLDLAMGELAYCEVSGEQVTRRTVRGLEPLREWLGPEQAPAVVAIEACREAWHVHDVLTSWNNKVLLVDTTRIKQTGVGQHGRKNDRLDAEALARAVEQGRVPLAHVLSPARREIRKKLQVRATLLKCASELIIQIRGMAREQGERIAKCESNHFVAQVQRAALSESTRALVAPLLSALTAVQQQFATIDQEIEALYQKEPVVERLMTAPGVGLIVALAFVSVIDEAKRFHSAHQVESYLGLVPRESSSGGRDKQRLGAITKQGNSMMRALLVQAAWAVLRQNGDDPLKRWAQHVAKRRPKNVAVIALARRLAGLLWAIWRDGSVYEPTLLSQAMSRGQRLKALDAERTASALERAAIKLRERRARRPKLSQEVAHSA